MNLLLSSLIVWAVLGLGIAQAQGVPLAPQAVYPAPAAVTPTPAAPLSLELLTTRPNGVQYPRDIIRFRATLNQAGYLYLFDVRTDYQVMQIFPNDYDTNHYLPIGTTELPRSDSYRFVIDSPAGYERVVALHSPQALSRGGLEQLRLTISRNLNQNPTATFTPTVSLVDTDAYGRSQVVQLSSTTLGFQIAELSSPVLQPPAGQAQAERNRLLTEWAAWRESGLGQNNYSFVFKSDCFCTPEYRRPIKVTVIDGIISSLVYTDNGAAVQRSDIKTIDELFAFIHQAFVDGAASVAVTYEPTYHYPVSIAIDHQAQMADEETYINVSDFQILPCGVVGCNPSTTTPTIPTTTTPTTPTPTPTDPLGNCTPQQDQRSEISLAMLETYPVQVVVCVKSQWPNTCPVRIEQSRQGTIITLRAVQEDPYAICGQAFTPYAKRVTVETAFLGPATYNVVFEGQSSPFTLY